MSSPPEAPPGEPLRRLFGALWALGLDRREPSIHEMLTDILEVIAVARGLKPAHLAAHESAWRTDGFERAAREAGLHTLRTAPMIPAAERYDALVREYPRVAAALRERAADPAQGEVLWIHREAGLDSTIRALAGGDRSLVCAVLGYPRCCALHDAAGDIGHVRALLRLYEQQYGIGDDASVAAALAEGRLPRPDPAASREFEAVWRTRIVYPYLGYTACPACLEQPARAPSAPLHRAARSLAFSLDPGFAHAIWRAALQEAALATTGHFQSLDPAPGDACPCASGLAHGDCCARIAPARPEFRQAP